MFHIYIRTSKWMGASCVAWTQCHIPYRWRLDYQEWCGCKEVNIFSSFLFLLCCFICRVQLPTSFSVLFATLLFFRCSHYFLTISVKNFRIMGKKLWKVLPLTTELVEWKWSSRCLNLFCFFIKIIRYLSKASVALERGVWQLSNSRSYAMIACVV